MRPEWTGCFFGKVATKEVLAAFDEPQNVAKLAAAKEQAGGREMWLLDLIGWRSG